MPTVSSDPALVATPIGSSFAVEADRFVELRRISKLRSRMGTRMVAIAIALPVVLAAIFVFLIATPMYTTEVRFSIRGGSSAPQIAAPGGSLLMAGNNPLDGFVDGYAARDFIVSRDALLRLSEKIDFKKMFVRPGADPLVRLPTDADEDRLYDAYASRVAVRYNMMEQIVVLDVQAFSPADSETLARALIDLTEEFADQMNLRARRGALKSSEDEVGDAERRASAARLALARWRDETGIVDPTADVVMLNGLIGQMETQLTADLTELATIEASGARDHPRKRSLLTEIQTLKDRIAETRKRLGGDGGGGTADKLARFEALKIAQEYAESNLASARQALDAARQATLRQQKYVTLVAAPRADGRPSYPARLATLLAALVVGVGLAFFGSLLISIGRAHFDA